MLTELGCFVLGYSGSMTWNYISGVPLHRGQVKNVLCGIVIAVAGNAVTTYLDKQAKKHLFQLEEYVRTHPEDFPPVERKKWGEVFQPWKAPLRPSSCE